MNNTKKVTLIALVLTAIGSFLPWASIQSVFGTIEVSGTSGDGIITLLLAIVTGCFICFGSKFKMFVWAAIFSVLGLIISIGEIFNVTSKNDEEFAIVQVGYGLYLCVIGFTVGAIGSYCYAKNQLHEDVVKFEEEIVI